MASPFSGSAGRKASVAVAKFLSDGQTDVNNLIEQRQKQSLRELSTNYQKGVSNYRDAIKRFQPYADTGLKAFSGYADATGVNGQEGYDRAEGNFRASPGYEWQVDEATDAVARKASSLGALGSGNTMAAITDRASHLADQEYDDYLTRLDGIGKTGFAATGAQAGLEQGIGNLNVAKGRDRSGVFQHSLDLGVDSRMQTNQGIAGAIQGGMMAGQNAAANRWNFGMQGLKLLADFAGSASGGKALGLT